MVLTRYRYRYFIRADEAVIFSVIHDVEALDAPELDDAYNSMWSSHGKNFLRVVNASGILSRRWFDEEDAISGDTYYKNDGCSEEELAEMAYSASDEEEEVAIEMATREKNIGGIDLVTLYEELLSSVGWEYAFRAPNEKDEYWRLS